MIALVAVAGVGLCAAEDRAHLLIQKSILTNRPFAGKDCPVRYRIFNVGSRFALALLSLHPAWRPLLIPIPNAHMCSERL